MAPLKDLYYNPKFFSQLAQKLQVVYPKFKRQEFYQEAIAELPSLELKQRIALTTKLCRKYLPDNYKKAVWIFYDLREYIEENFSYIFLPDFIATYGQGHFDMSMQALKDFTRFSSSEFGVRSYLNKDLQRTLKYMHQWAEDDDVHVRRLVTEGSRPRLPWAIRVESLIQDPTLTLPLVNKLKTDKERYVQKSVANHLNDISKDHPEHMLDEIQKWDKADQSIQWIVKHATRSLIKKGHPRALALMGATHKVKVGLSTFTLSDTQLHLGESLTFKLCLQSKDDLPQKLVVDYKIHYRKNSGSINPKVFKLKQILLQPGEAVNLSKKHQFKDFTTRKHYAGEHAVEIVVNGNSLATKRFQLQT